MKKQVKDHVTLNIDKTEPHSYAHSFSKCEEKQPAVPPQWETENAHISILQYYTSGVNLNKCWKILFSHIQPYENIL